MEVTLDVLGIDLAKLTFDATLRTTAGAQHDQSFPNTSDGFTQLPTWLTHLGVTLIILLLGVFIGMPAGLIFIALRRWLPGSWLRQGLAFSALITLVLGYPLYTGPLREEAGLGHRYLAFGLFYGLFLLLGLTIERATTGLEQVLPAAQTRRSSAAAVLALGFPVAVALGVLTLMIGAS